jgi:hypothetical protein
MVVRMLINPWAKFNTSVKTEFIKETYIHDWGVRL